MWIVFSSQLDTSAQWAIQGLRARGVDPVEWVTSESLPQATRWDHRIGQSGTTLELTLVDGRTIHSDQVAGVLNRIQFLPDHTASAAEADRNYVQQEMTAFYLSWLNSFPGIILNPSHPHGLAGALRHPSNWNYLAARAGLDTPPYRLTSRDPWQLSWQAEANLPENIQNSPKTVLFLIDGEVVPATGHATPPPSVRDAVIRLGKLSLTPLMALQFANEPAEKWVFVGADTLPDLTPGGDGLLDAMARAFTSAEPSFREATG